MKLGQNVRAALLTGFSIFIFTTFPLIGCKKEQQAAPPPPEVEVVTVVQKDVPIYSE